MASKIVIIIILVADTRTRLVLWSSIIALLAVLLLLLISYEISRTTLYTVQDAHIIDEKGTDHTRPPPSIAACCSNTPEDPTSQIAQPARGAALYLILYDSQALCMIAETAAANISKYFSLPQKELLVVLLHSIGWSSANESALSFYTWNTRSDGFRKYPSLFSLYSELQQSYIRQQRIPETHVHSHAQHSTWYSPIPTINNTKWAHDILRTHNVLYTSTLSGIFDS